MEDAGSDVITDEDCEALALMVIRETGLDDRPDADPRTVAVGWGGLRLRPEPGASPYLANGTIVYPAGVAESAEVWFVGHELGHDVLHWAGYTRLDRAVEEAAASRIASAIILPRRAFVRDLHATRGNVAALCELWPLATPWVIARRISEVTGAGASLFGPRGGRALQSVCGGAPEHRAVDVSGQRVAVAL